MEGIKRIESFKCDICGTEFKKINALIRHKKNIHEVISRGEKRKNIFKGNINKKFKKKIKNETKYSCVICNNIFKTENLLKKHKIKVHTDLNKFKLKKKIFYKKENIINKYKQNSKKNKKYACKYCYSFFLTEKNLKEHLVSLHNIK